MLLARLSASTARQAFRRAAGQTKSRSRPCPACLPLSSVSSSSTPSSRLAPAWPQFAAQVQQQVGLLRRRRRRPQLHLVPWGRATHLGTMLLPTTTSTRVVVWRRSRSVQGSHRSLGRIPSLRLRRRALRCPIWRKSRREEPAVARARPPWTSLWERWRRLALVGQQCRRRRRPNLRLLHRHPRSRNHSREPQLCQPSRQQRPLRQAGRSYTTA